MSTEHEQDDGQHGDQPPEGDGHQDAVPDHPRARQAETVQALEDRHAGDDPDDGETVTGDDVTEHPDTDEMEGLPGPPAGHPGEPSG